MQFRLKLKLLSIWMFSFFYLRFMIMIIAASLTRYPDGDAEDDEAEDQEDDGPRAGKLRADAGHLPAVGAPGQRVVEGVEEECVVTVGAGHPAHPRHIGQRSRHRGRRGQVDDPLAVRPEHGVSGQ